MVEEDLAVALVEVVVGPVAVGELLAAVVWDQLVAAGLGAGAGAGAGAASLRQLVGVEEVRIPWAWVVGRNS